MEYHTKFGIVEVDETKDWWKGYAYIKREDLLPDYPDYFMPYESPDGEIVDLPDFCPNIYYNVVDGDHSQAPGWLIEIQDKWPHWLFWKEGKTDE